MYVSALEEVLHQPSKESAELVAKVILIESYGTSILFLHPAYLLCSLGSWSMVWYEAFSRSFFCSQHPPPPTHTHTNPSHPSIWPGGQPENQVSCFPYICFRLQQEPRIDSAYPCCLRHNAGLTPACSQSSSPPTSNTSGWRGEEQEVRNLRRRRTCCKSCCLISWEKEHLAQEEGQETPS